MQVARATAFAAAMRGELRVYNSGLLRHPKKERHHADWNTANGGGVRSTVRGFFSRIGNPFEAQFLLFARLGGQRATL